MPTLAAVMALVACVHARLCVLFQRLQASASIDGAVVIVCDSPYARSLLPDYVVRPVPQQIRADRKRLGPCSQAIVTYSSTGGGELVVAIAAEFGLKVTLGI